MQSIDSYSKAIQKNTEAIATLDLRATALETVDAVREVQFEAMSKINTQQHDVIQGGVQDLKDDTQELKDDMKILVRHFITTPEK